jgi:NitT/TauT family transport system substrate-binding protein
MIKRRELLIGGAACFVATRLRAADLVQVRVGITNTATDVGFWVAHKKGYFAAEGLDVSFVPFNSAAQMIVPFVSGDLEVGSGAPSAALYNAIGRGIDVRMVSDKSKNIVGRGSQRLLVRRDLVDSGRYRTLPDLRGLKIAISADGSSTSTVFDKILQKAGLTRADVTAVVLGFPDQVTALANAAIDAALPAEPAVTQAIRTTGAVPVINDYDVYPRHQIATVLYSGAFASRKPELAQNFLKAFLRGVRTHNDALDADGRFRGPEGDEIIAILTEYGPYKDASIYRSFVLAYCDPDGTLDVPSLEEDLKIFKSQGLIESKVEVANAIDDSFLASVLRDIGPYSPRK